MRRSMKYGLYAVVLAGVVGATVAWANVDKTITLRVDGEVQKIHTVAGNVRGVLEVARYPVGQHDVVAPDLNARVHNGSQIVLRRGRLLHLNVDGIPRSIWVTAPTVAEALGELGYSGADFSSVSRDMRLPLSPTAIMLRAPKHIMIIADGRTRAVTTTAPTASALLQQLGIAVGPQDLLSAVANSPLRDGETIDVTRVKSNNIVKDHPVPFPTTSVNDPSMYVGDSQLVQPGRNGVESVTTAVVYVDGQVVGRTIVKRIVTTAPVPAIVHVGTKPKPAPVINVDPGSAQAIAKQLAAQRGWGNDQFSCLYQMWSNESGWRVDATNAGSGAYGIPQALPGDKMAAYGSDWQTNPTTQIKWGLDYIAGRYGTPCGAWDFWQANGYY